MTVYRVLRPLVDKKKQAKSIRSPGWRGTNLSVNTRADILLVDKYGELLSRPWLTTVIDTYSRCIVGINLGFDAPSSQLERQLTRVLKNAVQKTCSKPLSNILNTK
jgi:putative transposase